MRAQFFGGVLLAGFSLISASLYAVAPKEIFAPVERVFIAEGFDDNDNVEVSLYGNFSDTCFRVGPTGFNIDHAKRKIQIWAKAYDYSSREMTCLDVLTPFLLKVSVGVLEQGEYTVEVTGQPISEKMQIAKSTSDSPDEFLYAPVTYTHLETLDNGKQKATISGQFPRLLHGCMILKETRHYVTAKNVLILLPIAEVLDDDAQCKNVKETFKDEIIFNSFTDVGLLHVRVSNGYSQTQLITLP